MTEVPEHLLQRSRERRAAMTGQPPPAPAGGAEGGGAVEPAGGAAAPAAAGGAAPPARVAPPAAPTFTGPPQLPPPKRRVPIWAMPVIVALPFWALLYSGAFGPRPSTGPATPVERGQVVFASAGCSTCHGASGGGGVGPPLLNVTKTFPIFADQIKWVEEGSAPLKGQTYGNSGRVATGGMPAFGKQLPPADIIAVVCHERVDYAHESPVPAQCQAGGAATAAATTSK